MTINFNPETVFQFNDLLALVEKTFANEIFPGNFGFRFIEDVSIGDYYATNIFISDNKLHANTCRWLKQEDANRYWNPLERAQLKGIFTPTLITEEIILSNEEKEYFIEFLEKLLVEPEGQILEQSPGLLLDGSRYILQIFNHGKIVRVFRWTDAMKTRGLMQQVMKLSSHVRRSSK